MSTEHMNNNAALQSIVEELQTSKTMRLICEFAHLMPIDPKDSKAIKTAILTKAMDVMRALDNGRIHFDDDQDNAMLHGLLLVAMQSFFDGELTDCVKLA